jgi:hypothetical protein
VSGHRSVELRDVAGDGDFPELQGYFPVRGKGHLFFHFAFLTTDPKQELNIALAGPRYFQLEKDGIAFWLGTRDGRLVHHSDRIPKRLFVATASPSWPRSSGCCWSRSFAPISCRGPSSGWRGGRPDATAGSRRP